MTNPKTCTGWVTALREQTVLYTGTCRVDGQHMGRRDLQQRTRDLGGRVAPDRSKSVTVLVYGELWTGRLHDEQRRYSQKAVFIERVMRETGRHIHVIDDVGFGELLRGRPARCYDLRAP